MGDTNRSTDSQNLETIKIQEADDSTQSNDGIRQMNDTVVFPVHFWIRGTDAATDTNYTVIFIAPMPCVIVKAYETHKTAGNAGTSLRLMKLTTGQAEGDGVNLLSSDIALDTTADTPVAYTPTTIIENRRLSAGDRVELTCPTGATSANTVIVTCLFKVNLKDLPQ